MLDMVGNVLASSDVVTKAAETATSVAAASDAKYFAIMGAVLACGMIIIGAAVGIGMIASKSVDSIARQPEAGGRIFTSMIVAAALLEGVTFFALLVCMLAVLWLK